MTDIVVSDTGPLIALGALNLLTKLDTLFQTIYITPTVEYEAIGDPSRPGVTEIERAIASELIKRQHTTNHQALKTLLEILDPGEAEALALAEELDIDVILDEKKGRRVAKMRGITPRGTGAILIKLKHIDAIEYVAPYLDLLRQNGYRLSDQLCRDILDLCNEKQSQA